MNGQTCPIEKVDRLLVATDGTKYSEGALREAISLAKVCSSKLIIMSVIVSNQEYESALVWQMENSERKMRAKLESIRRKVSQEGVDCQVITCRGEDPYLDIVNEAEKNQVKMVIMGSHGRTGIKRVIMGSVAGKVIGHASCNVLVVHPEAKIGYKNIVIATDGSRHSTSAASEAIVIAKRCESFVSIVSVASSDAEAASAKENVRQVAELAKQNGIKNEGIIIQGLAHEAIVRHAKQKGADLIVVGSHGRTGLMSILVGTVAERVVGHAECAVLVVKI
ncbi:MAG: universal stress protein [Syntrophobacteraceae bacterium]